MRLLYNNYDTIPLSMKTTRKTKQKRLKMFLKIFIKLIFQRAPYDCPRNLKKFRGRQYHVLSLEIQFTANKFAKNYDFCVSLTCSGRQRFHKSPKTAHFRPVAYPQTPRQPSAHRPKSTKIY